MQSVLGLDISSSTIGWSLIEFDDKVVKLSDYGYIKPPNSKKGSLSYRLDEARKEIEGLILKKNPDFVAVEDYAKKFTKGRSSAHTIIVLSVFNEMCCLSAYRLIGKDVYRYPVATVRSTLGKHFGIKIVSKDDIFPVIVSKCKKFVPKINRVGNIKKESGDEADSIAVALTFILKEFDNGQRYNI
jgi:Holliday junction resolvasome RuvABC endonuclease subunit